MEIIEKLLSDLKDREIWFTTEHDPVFKEPKAYYELDKYGEPTERAKKQIEKEITDKIGDGAITEQDAIDVFIYDNLAEEKLAYKDFLVTQFEDKPIVPGIEAEITTKALTESARVRLKEENNKSLNLISSKIQDPKFDSESKEGQIVIRTQELFNVLSDKGYDVQVSFDNGESQSTIIIGQQGGQVNITITDNSQLKAYLSGNIELNKDNINTFTDIMNEIDVL